MTAEPTKSENPMPAEATRKSLGGRINWDRKIELIFAGAITVATAANCATSYFQWQALRETNQIATRPYIKLHLRPEAFVVSGVRAGADEFVGIKFRIENFGKTPALVWVRSSANWSGRGHPADDKQWPSIGVEARRFVFPGDDGPEGPEYPSYVIGLTQGQRTDIATGDRYYVMLDAVYGPSKNLELNGPSEEYRTKICVVYQMKRTDDVITLGEGEPCPSDGNNSAK